MILCSVNQKGYCIKVEAIRKVHSYEVDSVNCDIRCTQLLFATGYSLNCGATKNFKNLKS